MVPALLSQNTIARDVDRGIPDNLCLGNGWRITLLRSEEVGSLGDFWGFDGALDWHQGDRGGAV